MADNLSTQKVKVCPNCNSDDFVKNKGFHLLARFYCFKCRRPFWNPYEYVVYSSELKPRNAEGKILNAIQEVLALHDPDIVKPSIILNRIRTILGFKDLASAPLMRGQLSTGIEALLEALNHLNRVGEPEEAKDYIKGVIAGNQIAIAKAGGK